MSRWWNRLVEGIGRKLQELRDLLDTPLVAPEPVRIPVRPRRDRAPR